MKEKAISKINKFGKIGEIIAKIAFVVVIMGGVILLAAGALSMVLPKDFLGVEYYNGMNVEMDLEAYQKAYPTEDIRTETVQMELGQISINQSDMYVSDVLVDEENNIVTLNMESEPVNMLSPGRVVLFLVCELLLIAVNGVTVYFIIKLCKEFKTCESPFSQGVIKRMKQVAYSLIPWCIAYPLGEGAAKLMVSNELNISLDLGIIVTVLVVLALTHIFKYGAMLQQESDETL